MVVLVSCCVVLCVYCGYIHFSIDRTGAFHVLLTYICHHCLLRGRSFWVIEDSIIYRPGSVKVTPIKFNFFIVRGGLTYTTPYVLHYLILFI